MHLGKDTKSGSFFERQGWIRIDNADIGIGPGSYFLNDNDISVEYPNVQTKSAAWEKVDQLENSGNPIVMWEILPGGMRAHRYKFFEQNYSGKSQHGMSAEKFVRHTADFLRGKADNNGNPVIVRVDQWGSKEWKCPISSVTPLTVCF